MRVNQETGTITSYIDPTSSDFNRCVMESVSDRFTGCMYGFTVYLDLGGEIVSFICTSQSLRSFVFNLYMDGCFETRCKLKLDVKIIATRKISWYVPDIRRGVNNANQR